MFRAIPYEGVGPSGAKIGDDLFVIIGCPLLLVLRAVGDRYQVIGDAFVDGFLDGQVMAGDQNRYHESRARELVLI